MPRWSGLSGAAADDFDRAGGLCGEGFRDAAHENALGAAAAVGADDEDVGFHDRDNGWSASADTWPRAQMDNATRARAALGTRSTSLKTSNWRRSMRRSSSK